MTRTVFFNTALTIIFSLACLSQTLAEPSDNAAARDLFEQMNRRFAGLTSLSYTVNRTSTTGKQTVDERWDFKLKMPALIKVEYFAPIHRHLVISEDATWEYIPAAKKALRNNLAAMTTEKKSKTVMALMAHVSLDGLRLGDYSKMLTRVTSVTRGRDNLYVIQGLNPKFVVHVDGEKGTLVHFELYDEKGDLVMQTEASQFIKVGPEFWFPQDIMAIYRTEKGIVKSRIVLTNIKANETLDDELFKFTPPKGVQVMTN